MVKKIVIRVLIGVILLLAIFIIWMVKSIFPVISGYGAKNVCSDIYLQHRNARDVIKEDVADFPISMATYTINAADSSVTGSVWGMARQKAIYRTGAGATLINGFTEKEVRSQLFSLPKPPPLDQDTIPWPYGNKLTGNVPAEIDLSRLNAAVQAAFSDTYHGKPVYTRALLVVCDGELVAERYADGFDRNTMQLGWSVAKSFMGALTGILVKQGKLDPDRSAPVAEWVGTNKSRITLKELLQQTTGLDYAEMYARPSEATTMLFRTGDMAAYAAGLPLKYEPGTVWNYSGGNSNILSRIIRQTTGEQEYRSFPYSSLFYKIGMFHTILEPDASGTYVGSSYCYATARDFARFGLLYYNNGKFNNEQILPEQWVYESTRSSPADKLNHYGYQFWLNGWSKANGAKRQYPDVPADMFYADGYNGQDIYIIPSRRMVVVRLGLHVMDENKMLREIIGSIK
jgi:CubicO group peptidase (beta-lactamase class C family)